VFGPDASADPRLRRRRPRAEALAAAMQDAWLAFARGEAPPE
jgi:hypothetical protein